jgi:hypothetical protein
MDLIGNRSRYLSACSVVPQTTTGNYFFSSLSLAVIAVCTAAECCSISLVPWTSDQ